MLNKWDLSRVLNLARKGEFLTVSGRLFQVSVEAKLRGGALTYQFFTDGIAAV